MNKNQGGATNSQQASPSYPAWLLDSRGRIDIKSLSLSGILSLVRGMGKERFRATQVYKWIWQKDVASFQEMTNIAKTFRAELADHAYLPVLELAALESSTDGTRKLLWTLEDGLQVESVLIPEPDRLTLCISSQVGCAMGCRFCLTGGMGLLRNLKPSEILMQVAQARSILEPGERISNLVLMGMGEPLHNLENVLVALEILLDENAFNFSHRKVTVSTVGLVPPLRELSQALPVNLAISLNATTDEQRGAIMPVNRRHDLHALLEACRVLELPAGKRITFEYVMIRGFNDSMADARRLAALLRGIRSKVNLIPYNENPDRSFRSPPDHLVKAFQDLVINEGIQCSVRLSRGQDISAACGQLGSRAAGSGRARRNEPHVEETSMA